MGEFLTWLHNLGTWNPRNIMFFRETTPSHFDTISEDGFYESWHQSEKAHYDFNKANIWYDDTSLYYCRSTTMAKSTNRTNVESELSNLYHARNTAENIIASKILKAWGNSSRVQILSAFDYLAPFYRFVLDFPLKYIPLSISIVISFSLSHYS